MTVSKIEELFPGTTGINQERLSSKKKNDRVGPQIKKPESGNSGSSKKNRDSLHESADGTTDNSIIADRPNFYNNYGIAMENFGYFILPRSVTSDPRYQGARLKYQKVLFIIFENVAFAPTTHAISTEIIPIQIGQLCVSERNLMDLCNEGVKYKEDKIDKNIAHRAVHFWSRCGFVRQEVIHDKTLLTITVPGFYERNKKTSEPASEAEVRQNRTSKEEYKEDKEDNIISSVAAAPSEKKKISSSSKKRKKAEPVPLIERDKGVFISDIAHQKLIEEKGSEEIVKQIYSSMAVWKAQNGISGGDDYRTAIKWSMSTKKIPRTYNNPSQPKFNHDKSPSHPSKKISFAEEV